mmetsp:Transcript_120118/g.336285  ORF Transcript_120118/g.336285 Transcript_120118/m.336285 type:complete len:81 (-) Transcript_120118:26-268(-)
MEASYHDEPRRRFVIISDAVPYDSESHHTVGSRDCAGYFGDPGIDSLFSRMQRISREKIWQFFGRHQDNRAPAKNYRRKV